MRATVLSNAQRVFPLQPLLHRILPALSSCAWLQGWRVRLRVRFLRGEEGASRCGASQPALLSAK